MEKRFKIPRTCSNPSTAQASLAYSPPCSAWTLWETLGFGPLSLSLDLNLNLNLDLSLSLNPNLILILSPCSSWMSETEMAIANQTSRHYRCPEAAQSRKRYPRAREVWPRGPSGRDTC